MAAEGRNPAAVSALRCGARRDVQRLRLPPAAAVAAAAGRGCGGWSLSPAERREGAASPAGPLGLRSAGEAGPGNEGLGAAGGASGGPADPLSPPIRSPDTGGGLSGPLSPPLRL